MGQEVFSRAQEMILKAGKREGGRACHPWGERRGVRKGSQGVWALLRRHGLFHPLQDGHSRPPIKPSMVKWVGESHVTNSRILQMTPRESQLAKRRVRSKSQCPLYFKVFVFKNKSEHLSGYFAVLKYSVWI